MKRSPIPTYLPHKQSGRGRAVWSDNGVQKQKLLPGPFGSDESRKAFGTLLVEMQAAPRVTRGKGKLTIDQLLFAYWDHAMKHYRGVDGKPTSETYEIKIVMRAIRELYGDKPVAEFGPLCLKAACQKWVNEKRSRTECNRRLALVKRIMKWAVSEELAPAGVYHAVVTVTGLQKGRTTAHEMEPVGPVDDAVVDATLPFLNRHIRGLIELGRLTGARPGECCSIRRCDIDTGGAIWLYKPAHHKTAHKGKSRTIAIGPRAQELLRGFFTTSITDYLFSPIRAVEEMTGKRPRTGKRMPKEKYDRTSYTRAIARAVELANANGEGKPIPHWFPNQLRHSYATKVRKQHGLEAAQVLLGHSRADVTQIYAERNSELAATVAAKIG